jgi:hypothetical protein
VNRLHVQGAYKEIYSRPSSGLATIIATQPSGPPGSICWTLAFLHPLKGRSPHKSRSDSIQTNPQLAGSLLAEVSSRLDQNFALADQACPEHPRRSCWEFTALGHHAVENPQLKRLNRFQREPLYTCANSGWFVGTGVTRGHECQRRISQRVGAALVVNCHGIIHPRIARDAHSPRLTGGTVHARSCGCESELVVPRGDVATGSAGSRGCRGRRASRGTDRAGLHGW